MVCRIFATEAISDTFFIANSFMIKCEEVRFEDIYSFEWFSDESLIPEGTCMNFSLLFRDLDSSFRFLSRISVSSCCGGSFFSCLCRVSKLMISLISFKKCIFSSR